MIACGKASRAQLVRLENGHILPKAQTRVIKKNHLKKDCQEYNLFKRISAKTLILLKLSGSAQENEPNYCKVF